MKTSSTWNFRSIAGKIMLGLVLTVMAGSIDVVPALAQNDYGRVVRHDNRRDNRRYQHRGRRHVQQRRVYRPYDHRERFYVPPRVIYAPPPPPGIRVFFPPIIIHP